MCTNVSLHEITRLHLDYFLLFLPQEIAFPKMVASCCRFLCYFCRISRQNQKAMFDHLSYLLENSSVGLGNTGPTQSHTNTNTVHPTP
jgi:hypothetical protein